MPFLLIDKPKGCTSHDVVDKIRKITGEKKVGHGGTLDPNATGLLILGVGRDSTRQLQTALKGLDKSYLAEIELGKSTSTDDSEGEIIHENNSLKPTKDEIVTLLEPMVGEQLQMPPQFSALKIKGKKAYDLARKGKTVELKPRTIFIHSIQFIGYDYPLLTIELSVSSGTYIRSIARDLGEKLGTFGHLKNLRRTQIGSYLVENSFSLTALSQENWKEKGLPLLS